MASSAEQGQERDGPVKQIPLTKGQFALVDDADYAWLSGFKWQARWNRYTRSFYASRGENFCRADGQRRQSTVSMHRQILGLKFSDKRQVDHIAPGQTLDNRRSNLRIATHTENARNAKLRRDNTSGFKGVKKVKDRQSWRARITAGGHRISLGHFSSPELAHAAYCDAAKRYHGEFARFA